MYPDNYIPERLVKHFRGELTAQEHLGFVLTSDFSLGETFGYPFYLRSCAKPLQAALIVDYDIDFNDEEIALCCASHAGEDCHVELAKKLLNKIGLNETNLKCGTHRPISKTADEKLLLSGNKETVFHNNCVGKHIMMLALCLKNGWNIENYDDIEHPVQKLIKEKIYDLCEIEEDYPISRDGCGVPVFSMPLGNMLKGYLNLFTADKYSKITKAFLDNPYIIGGEDRLDTKIMQNSKHLVAKVGAGGLCIVVNLDLADALLVKVLDCDMQAREISTLSMLKKMDWANIPYETAIRTLHGEEIGLMKFVGLGA